MKKEYSSNPVFLLDNNAYDHTFGKVMTLLEAVYPASNKEQKEAIKSLVRDAFYGGHYYDLSHPVSEQEWEKIRLNTQNPLSYLLMEGELKDTESVVYEICRLFSVGYQWGAGEVDSTHGKDMCLYLSSKADEDDPTGKTWHVSVTEVDV